MKIYIDVFAKNSEIKYEDNILYKNDNTTIIMNIETRKEETKKFYKTISLEKIKKRVSNPDWWFATRTMCVFVLVAEKNWNKNLCKMANFC